MKWSMVLTIIGLCITGVAASSFVVKEVLHIINSPTMEMIFGGFMVGQFFFNTGLVVSIVKLK